jgi:hypothetical protein
MTILDKFHLNKHQVDANLINHPLWVITEGNVVSYEWDEGIISEIVYKYKDIYYTFRISGQTIHEDPQVQTRLASLINSELYGESWSR